MQVLSCFILLNHGHVAEASAQVHMDPDYHALKYKLLTADHHQKEARIGGCHGIKDSRYPRSPDGLDLAFGMFPLRGLYPHRHHDVNAPCW